MYGQLHFTRKKSGARTPGVMIVVILVYLTILINEPFVTSKNRPTARVLQSIQNRDAKNIDN